MQQLINDQKTVSFVVKCPFKTIYNNITIIFSSIKKYNLIIYQIWLGVAYGHNKKYTNNKPKLSLHKYNVALWLLQ